METSRQSLLSLESMDVPVEKAAQVGRSPTQIIFLWVKSKGAVIVTMSPSKQHLEEYFATGGLPPLTEEAAAVDAASANGPPGVLLRSMKEHLLLQRVWLLI
ncbi:hypothetical protein BYT27DRAFT_6441590 [Phlegmacium glaucopus]|nr:hypothetical protein BYT27DRAFT_6441590 [Phlegmacium glaucopus]